jgi:hypothetical protein
MSPRPNPKHPYTFTDADRQRAWKEIANDPTSRLTDLQRAEVKDRGWRGPRQLNRFGEWETMELAHEPIPLREGGRLVVPMWPEEHAASDPDRHLKKR